MTLGWDDHDSAVRQVLDEQLLNVVVPEVVTSAKEREQFSHELACRWHELMTDTIDVQPPQAAGNLRHPSWCHGEVVVDGYLGTPTARLETEVAHLEADLVPRFADLDRLIPAGAAPAGTGEVERVLRLAADLHGEWVRIHPFANGNGRMSRLWCNWTLIRYGIRPLVRPTPRPQWGIVLGQPGHPDRYEWAAQMSMTVGNHAMMYAELKSRYKSRYGS